MNAIRYNDAEEAFEINYKIWNNEMTVRFYVEDQQKIIDNLSTVAQALAKLDGGRKKVCESIVNDGYYTDAIELLEKSIRLLSVYVDIDEEGVVLCFTVECSDGYLAPLSIELYEDEFEPVGWV